MPFNGPVKPYRQRDRQDPEKMAQAMLDASESLGRAIELVNRMGAMLWSEIDRSGIATDNIVTNGPSIVRAFNVLAITLDRNAYGNRPNENAKASGPGGEP